MFTEELGLGIVVTISPTIQLERERYWFKAIVDDYARQYREAGYVDGIPDSVGLSGWFSSMFGGGGGRQPEAPKIPWAEIYTLARPLAKQYATQEEEGRKAQEKYDILTKQYAAIAEKREQGLLVPAVPMNNVVTISRGALVIQPTGKPVETRKP